MSGDDVVLSDLRRRIEALIIERDNATLALGLEEQKRDRLHADIRELRRELSSMKSLRIKNAELLALVAARERELGKTQRRLDLAITRELERSGGSIDLSEDHAMR